MSESELQSEVAITDTRDNDTSVAKARLAEYPAGVKLSWSWLAANRLMTSHIEHCSVTPGCRGQIGV